MSARRREKELKRRRKQADRARGPEKAPVAAAPPPNREIIARELGDPERLTLHIRRFSQLLATVDDLEAARFAYPKLVEALLEVSGDEILALPEDQRGLALRSRILPTLVSEHLAKMARQAIEQTASRAQDPMDRLALLAGRIFIDSWLRTKEAPEKNPGWEAIFGISVLDALFGGVVFSRLARAALVVDEAEASRAFAKALARAELAKELETLGLASPPETSAATLAKAYVEGAKNLAPAFVLGFDAVLNLVRANADFAKGHAQDLLVSGLKTSVREDAKTAFLRAYADDMTQSLVDDFGAEIEKKLVQLRDAPPEDDKAELAQRRDVALVMLASLRVFPIAKNALLASNYLGTFDLYRSVGQEEEVPFIRRVWGDPLDRYAVEEYEKFLIERGQAHRAGRVRSYLAGLRAEAQASPS
jgi:hypothetical protein